jgi:signal transduction histidine kinase
MRLSLRARLTLSFLVIIVVTTAIFVVLSNQVIISRFKNLVARSGQNYAQRIAPIFGRYYAAQGSWDGVDSLVSSLVSFPGNRNPVLPQNEPESLPNPFIAGNNERLILVSDGEVILDTNPAGPELIDDQMIENYGVSIIVNGIKVGDLVVASSLGIFTDLQSEFVQAVNRTLLLAAILSILAVLVVGITQSQSILKPVRQLATAALKVAKGDYSQRVKVARNDELGDMAQAFNSMAGDLAYQQELRHKSMADIAHELRTPLTILQIDLESMEDGLMEFNPENMRIIQNEVAHLNNLVEDLRILSQVDSGELRIETTNTEVGSIIREMIERQSNNMRDKTLKLTYLPPEEELFVKADPQRLSQVLINLISNAVQHTSPGGEIIVSSIRQNDEVLVSVEDNGEGIPQEDLAHIFDRLYRVEKSRSRHNGGSGLGLSIAKSLIEAQGGKIWAESEEGKGSVFRFTLPLIS